MPSSPHSPTVSVIIPTYSLDRWDLLVESVTAVIGQTWPPIELIICVDHNPELLQRCKAQWEHHNRAGHLPILIVPNRFEQSQSAGPHERAHGSKRRFGAGMARNTAAQLAGGEILAFLDDDAAPDPTWLECLIPPYVDPLTMAVGGAPLPAYETARPRWFPANFDWVFGCAYAGLPTELAPYPRLIGANLSVRRQAFLAVGGFHSIDFDDLDLCLRLADKQDDHRLMYEPRAVVHHYVPTERVTWRYFWRRCYYINREKVEVFAHVGSPTAMRAESQFVLRALTAQLAVDAHDVAAGRLIGLSRMSAMLVGITLAAAGNLVGRAQSALRRPPRARAA